MPLPGPPLPVDAALPALGRALEAAGAAVLVAPPGAGKSTRVPLALLDAAWRGDGRIVMLEPRRLAARAVAQRLAQQLGERPGGTVGFRVRGETKVSGRTRVEVVTEGVLTRMLHADPELSGVACVVFDEFHERSLTADLGLALSLQSRAILRPGLRVLVMSATLAAEGVAALLGDDAPAPIVRSEGRMFPVETRYLPQPVAGRMEDAAASAARRALQETTGDVLVFLPGAGEIRRTAERLTGLPSAVDVRPLYGAMLPREQDRAIEPSPAGRRKIVLSTDIAETSLTIEGVRAVVDAGLAREPRFSPRTGLTRLQTVQISRASADQRRGRAGRLGPGTCYRLWTEATHARLDPHGTPEIEQADLAPLALDLARWGTPNPADLRWMDPPPPGAYAAARDLLFQLGALDGRDANGRLAKLTPHGEAMSRFPLHPRFAHALLRMAEIGAEEGNAACAVAALLGERDVLDRAGGPSEADLRLRFDCLSRPGGALAGRGRVQGHHVRRGAADRARREADRLRHLLQLPDTPLLADHAGLAIALAYPDRIGQRQSAPPGHAGRFRLASGRSVALTHAQPLTDASFLAVADLDDRAGEARVYLAAPLDADSLQQHLSGLIETEQQVRWDDRTDSVVARKVERIGAVVLREGPLPDPDPERLSAALIDGVRASEGRLLPWSKATRRLQHRLHFLHHLDPSATPAFDDEALLADLDLWLLPYLDGARRAGDLGRLDLRTALMMRLGWERQAEFDRLAPEQMEIPTGANASIDYSDPAAPVLALRVQEAFGWEATPTVGDGRVPLTLHLLSPARRPVQVTQDLAGFWRTSYFDVRKDLRGRYPKHPWPEDPLSAEPTSRTKRRS